jgi:long-subunit fatty acid transport protein
MNKKILFMIVLFLCKVQITLGSSSIFGFGPNLLGSYQYPYSAAALGRGGFSMAVFDTVALNQANFATWSKLALSTFSVNVEYQNLNISSANNANISLTEANFKGGFIAWPLLQRRLTLGVGITPHIVGNLGVQIEDVGVGAPATQTVESSGTISEAKLIVAFKLTRNISVSLAPIFNFGVIKDQINIRYDNIAYGDISIENRYQAYGVSGEIGTYMEVGSWLAAGARFKLPANLTIKATQFSLSAEKTVEGNRDLKLPLDITAGMALKFSDRFLIGFDADYQDWKRGYELDNRRISNMHNSLRLGAGLEFGPTKDFYASYWQKMTIRAGAFYSQMNATANGNLIHEYGIAAGLGLPIRMNRNRFDIAAEFGRRGDKTQNFIEELFFRLNFSISTNELWFVQQDR